MGKTARGMPGRGREGFLEEERPPQPGELPWNLTPCCVVLAGLSGACGVTGQCKVAFSLTPERQPVAGDTSAQCGAGLERGRTGGTRRLLDLQEALGSSKSQQCRG